MINSGKIRDPNQFAKKLVEQRIAANMEEAMEKIQVHKDIVSEEDMSILDEPVEEQVDEKPAECKIEDSRLNEIEQRIKKLNDAVEQMKGIMNKNFREIDQRLSQAMKAKPEPEDREEEEKPVKKEKPHPKTGDPAMYKEKDISVESIFSNAHGRLNKNK
jgi:TolA-binding protein